MRCSGLVHYARSGGQRDFASATHIEADRYDVQVDGAVADEAQRLLRGNARRSADRAKTPGSAGAKGGPGGHPFKRRGRAGAPDVRHDPVDVHANSSRSARIRRTVGSLFDIDDVEKTESVLSEISKQVQPTRTAVLAQVKEQSPEVIDAAMARLGGEVMRRPVVHVEEEIAAAEEAQRKAEREARKEEDCTRPALSRPRRTHTPRPRS